MAHCNRVSVLPCVVDHRRLPVTDYKLNIPPMTIHFRASYPMRKKPVLSVSFDGENREYKVASFNDENTFKWFVECLEDALGGNK